MHRYSWSGVQCLDSVQLCTFRLYYHLKSSQPLSFKPKGNHERIRLMLTSYLLKLILFRCLRLVLLVHCVNVVFVAACDLVEKSCPDAICRGQTRFDGRLLWCTCKTDFCNSNITLIPELEAPQPPYFNIKGMTMIQCPTNR